MNDNKFMRKQVGKAYGQSQLEESEPKLTSYHCVITLESVPKNDGSEVEFYKRTLNEIYNVLLNLRLGINFENLELPYNYEKTYKNRVIHVFIEETPGTVVDDVKIKNLSYDTIKSKFEEMLEKEMLKLKNKTNVFENVSYNTNLINRRNNMRTIKSAGQFDSFRDFASYAERTYIPMLDKVSDTSYELTDKDRRLLAFLRDDMKDMINGNGIESACHGNKKRARKIKSSVDGKFSYLDENVQDAVAEVEKYLGIEAEPGDYYAYFNAGKDWNDEQTREVEKICDYHEVEYVWLDPYNKNDWEFCIMSYDDWNEE